MMASIFFMTLPLIGHPRGGRPMLAQAGLPAGAGEVLLAIAVPVPARSTREKPMDFILLPALRRE
jgi:hypothetical protein